MRPYNQPSEFPDLNLKIRSSTTLSVHLESARPTHDPSIDTFRIEYLLGPCVVLALLFHYRFTVSELLWSFSIFLESVAILPQLFMLQRTGEAETITTHYLAALGAYRALYIPNWMYRCVIVQLPRPAPSRLRVPLRAILALYTWQNMLLIMTGCRYFTEDVVDPIAVTAGLVQTALYLDFFYVYFTKCVPSHHTLHRRRLTQHAQGAARTEVRATRMNTHVLKIMYCVCPSDCLLTSCRTSDIGRCVWS